MTNAKEKLFGKEWGSRVLSALDVIDQAAAKQKYDAEHTADDVEIKIGMKVFVLDDPTVLWTISEIDKDTYRRRVLLEAKDQVAIKRHTTKLYVNQTKAVDACIKDIRQTEKMILRDRKDDLNRLDAFRRIQELKKLKTEL